VRDESLSDLIWSAGTWGRIRGWLGTRRDTNRSIRAGAMRRESPPPFGAKRVGMYVRMNVFCCVVPTLMALLQGGWNFRIYVVRVHREEVLRAALHENNPARPAGVALFNSMEPDKMLSLFGGAVIYQRAR